MEIRRAESRHRDAILKLITGGNAQPESRCLHCSDTEEELLGDLQERAKGVEDMFWVGLAGDEVVAAVGLDNDEEKRKSWLWGPYSRTHDKGQLMKVTDAALSTLPKGWQAFNFSDKRNTAVSEVMKEFGFVPDSITSAVRKRLWNSSGLIRITATAASPAR